MGPYRDDDRLAAAREAHPGWDIYRVFGGYLAVPAGAAVIQSVDVDGVTAKIRQREQYHGEEYTSGAVAAVTAAVRAEHDVGGWLADVLCRAAAALGSLDALTAGRPGSWESAHIDALSYGTCPDDEALAAYRVSRDATR
jgi:hypothetical protein